jgi:aconitate hydratase
MFFGIKAILTKSYARIHRSNLINFGIVPFTLKDPEEYVRIQQGDRLRITDLRRELQENDLLKIENVTQQRVFEVTHGLNSRERKVLLAGGLLNYTRNHEKDL